MKSKFYLIFTVFIFAYSCNKIKYYPDKDFEEVNTLIIAHRTAGVSSQFQENSVKGADYGLSLVDGVEVDLQISKDRTIWLAHITELPDCNGTSYNCFPEASDSEIIELDTCNGASINYTRLEDIFALMEQKYPGKYVALDVKIWSPCAITSLDVFGVMNVIADEIIRLTKKYNLQNQVMVESEVATFLNYIKRNSSGIDCYLNAYGDFERAMQLCLEEDYTGISFKYKFDEELTPDHIKLIRQKGLKIQLWTVNTQADIDEALLINPDFIQTDNLKYIEKLNL